MTKAYSTGGASAAAQELQRQSASLDSGQIDQLLTAVKPTLDAIGADLGARVKNNRDDSGDQKVTRDTLTALADVALRAGPAGSDLIGRSVAAGLPDQNDLNQFDDVLKDLGATAAVLSNSVVKGLSELGKTKAVGELKHDAIDGVNAAREAYTEASDLYAQTQARLAQELAAVAPSLDPQQRKAYEEAFWARPENANVREAEAAAADTLGRTLEAARPTLEALAQQGDKDAGKALVEGFEALSRSPMHGDDAVRWAGEMNAASPALFDALNRAVDGKLEQRLEENVIPQGLQNAQAEILGKNLSAEQSDAALTELLGGLKKTGKNLKNLPGAINTMLSELADLRAGKLDSVQRTMAGWERASPLKKALTAVAVTQGIFGAKDSIQNGDTLGALKNLLSTGKAGAELTGLVLTTLNKGFKIGQTELIKAGIVGAEAVETFAKFAGKFAPAVGLALDVLQLNQDIKNLQDGVSAGDIVGLIGTGVSIAGDIAGFIPGVGTAIDGVLTVAGGILQGIGGLLNGGGDNPGEPKPEEMEALLRKVSGMSEQEAQVVAQFGLGGGFSNFEDLGLSPKQMREVALAMVQPISTPEQPVFDDDMSWFAATAGIFGVKGQDAVDLIKLMDQGGTSYFSILRDAISSNIGEANRTGDFSKVREAIIRDLQRGGVDPDVAAQIVKLLERYKNAKPITEITTGLAEA